MCLDATKSAAARDSGMLPLFPTIDCQSAQEIIAKLARRQPEVTSDDLWREMEAQGVDEVFFPNRNAIGAAFHAAARRGELESTGRVIKSARVSAHRRNVLVWRSLVFEGVL